LITTHGACLVAKKNPDGSAAVQFSGKTDVNSNHGRPLAFMADDRQNLALTLL
jgi:hypothetical protein